MGSLTRKFANNFTTGGVYKPAAITNNSLANITDIPAAAKGKLTLISSQTASASASIEFTSGIDSTYHTYLFKFVNIHPSVDSAGITFQMDISGASNYNTTMTTTMFQSYHNEGDTNTILSYRTDSDQAQGTAFQEICLDIGNDNDQCCNGNLYIFSPSSTVYVKHFISRFARIGGADYAGDQFYAGYFNTTSALAKIKFQMTSGNIDAGTIYMYGIGA